MNVIGQGKCYCAWHLDSAEVSSQLAQSSRYALKGLLFSFCNSVGWRQMWTWVFVISCLI